MSDIVERLRRGHAGSGVGPRDCKDAADEIERLREADQIDAFGKISPQQYEKELLCNNFDEGNCQMSKIDQTLSDALEKSFANGLTEKTMECFQKDARKLADGIFDDLEWRIRDELAMQLCGSVVTMAERAVEAMLSGNEQEMRRWLSCDKRGPDHEYIGWTGRSDGYGNRKDDQWHPVIHGRLFEQGAVELRKRVAQANEALLRDERIRDLEDQLKSVVVQLNKAEAEKEAMEAMWQRVRALA